jgi:metal-responsive CopG/Arc/MetJ family transcriptional regulator
MKTAISLPDELFESVEKLVKRSGRSRSEVYAEALSEYVSRHAPDEVTESLNRVAASADDSELTDPFVNTAAREVLKNTEW